jgi:hypothetical protein
MGRTLPSITQAFLQEQQSLARFRRALRREDQQVLDELLAGSRHHLAAAAYASHLLPFEVMLLAMLLEQHKEVLRLRRQLTALEAGATHPSPSLGHHPADAARQCDGPDKRGRRELSQPGRDTPRPEG